MKVLRERAEIRPVTRQADWRIFKAPIDCDLLGIFGYVDQDRSRPPGAGDVEGFAHGVSDIARIGDQVIMFGDRQGNTGDIRLLEGIVTYIMAGDLTGDTHKRG